MPFRGLQRVRDLPRDRERLVHRQRPGSNSLRKRFPLDELEHQRLEVACLLEPVDRRDVRMVQGREDLRLALEPRQPLRVFGHCLGQDLDRDVSPELAVARAIHLPHPAGPQRSENFVRPEFRAGTQRHNRCLKGEDPLATSPLIFTVSEADR
jgi:hypothetical protein